MESKKILILAVIVGFVGMFFSFIYLQKKEDKLLKGMNLRPVLVAAKDIPIRTKIEANMLKVEKIPDRYIEPRTVSASNQQDVQRVIGMVNLVPISAGQQIMMSEIVPPSEATGVSVNVPPGLRAMIIQINNIDVIDLIKPNDRVDVITTFSAQHIKKGNVKVAVTIIQDALVIGVSKDLGQVEEYPDSDKKGKKDDKENKTMPMMTVTLAITSEQAQILALAIEQGDISLSIRSLNDREQRALGPIDSSMFLG